MRSPEAHGWALLTVPTEAMISLTLDPASLSMFPPGEHTDDEDLIRQIGRLAGLRYNSYSPVQASKYLFLLDGSFDLVRSEKALRHMSSHGVHASCGMVYEDFLTAWFEAGTTPGTLHGWSLLRATSTPVSSTELGDGIARILEELIAEPQARLAVERNPQLAELIGWAAKITSTLG